MHKASCIDKEGNGRQILVGRTPIGRTTIVVLAINHPVVIADRQSLIEVTGWPTWPQAALIDVESERRFSRLSQGEWWEIRAAPGIYSNRM